jgi:hypothetical protein
MNLRKHTHPDATVQCGAKTWAAAKPEKKRNIASATVRGDILCLNTQAGGGTGGGEKYGRSNG